MDSLLNFGILFISWFQSLGSWLTPLMKLFTFLGNEQFYLLVAPAILWCVDSTLGIRLALFLMINGMLNTAFKVVFHTPRPYWYSDQVRVFGDAEKSFGLPSGHAQNSVVVWGTIARRINRRWAWWAAIILMFLVGMSRIYLAVHFPHDVLSGWIIGAIVLWAFHRSEQPVVSWLKQYTIPVQLFLVFIFSLLLILIVIIAQASLLGWIVPQEWVKNAHLAFPTEPPLNPLSYHTFLSSIGAFLGMASGWIWITSMGGFTVRDATWKLVVRYLLGLVGVLVLYAGLGAVFSTADNFTGYAERYIRYALIGFWITGLAPWIFVKLKLAQRLH